jgi:hypothetical protein
MRHCRFGVPSVLTILGVGSIASAARDTYGHAFALLGLAWYYRWTNDMQALKIVNETLMFMDEALVCDRGGYLDAIPLPECDPQAKPSYAFI